VSRIEDDLRAALIAGTQHTEPAPDLFARVERSLQEQRSRQAWRQRILVAIAVGVTALLTFTALTIDIQEGELQMDWWIFELITFAVMAAIALFLGPFIKRFGRSYAAEVFRSNPTTGKSFIVLTDFAYYLIFTAYILFTTQVAQLGGWEDTVNADQVQYAVARFGGILLIIGILHSANLLMLPVIGRLLTLNRRLDQQMRELAERDLGDRDIDQTRPEGQDST
jgi:hypothetical protein